MQILLPHPRRHAPRLRLINRFPQSVDIGRAKCPVIQAIAGHHAELADLVPDHPAVIRADRPVKAGLIKRSHDFIHVKASVRRKVRRFLEVIVFPRLVIELEVSDMRKVNSSL